MSTPIKNRYDFVYLFDVTDGNPNGDPDGGNAPRIDPETGQGLVTDVCLKRKIRNYVELLAAQPNTARRDFLNIFIRQGSLLNDTLAENAQAAKEEQLSNQERMCQRFFDVRTFGAVMSTGDKTAKAGQVRGAIQMTFSRSIDPVMPAEHSITRMAKTDKKEDDKEKNEVNQTMGSKYTIPYGLYLCHGFVSPNFANKTGFSEDDLNLVWEALQNMFEVDHSASRGLMSARKLIIFKHESPMGNASAQSLFDRITIQAKNAAEPCRNFADYEVTINENDLPKGVTCEVMF